MRLDRRAFVAGGAAAVLVAPARARGQARTARVAYLSLAPGPSVRSEALRDGFRAVGLVEGQNLVIEWRWADGSLDRARAAAGELARTKVDVIVTGGPQATQAATIATTTIPIVMAVDYDPVGAGFVASLAHPGGNVTGLTAINPELSGKRLDLLRQVVPGLSRVAVLWNPAEPSGEAYLRETTTAARTLNVQVHPLPVKSASELDSLLQAAHREHDGAFIVLTDPVTLYNRKRLVELAAKYRLPTIYSERLFVEAGGLMSYGADDREMHRRAAGFVDRILKGEKPGDLPVQQPTAYELIISVRAARALGLSVPQSLMVRADQVVE
jgi:putative ABC transport system substrate-binding protein